MRVKETDDPDASTRPGEGRASAVKAVAADFYRQANVGKTRQKYSRLSSPCVAPVTDRP
ncbi:protein DedD [Mesorhizobium helmanticense]|uniref:Protein DedD n=1 Tax=Mesorhizobium helmanticense TaxID=1776423 RepID=A0A2T4IYQ1_9HYPH|nr:protein DedD [Mesorhizobium helmanticense]